MEEHDTVVPSSQLICRAATRPAGVQVVNQWYGGDSPHLMSQYVQGRRASSVPRVWQLPLGVADAGGEPRCDKDMDAGRVPRKRS